MINEAVKNGARRTVSCRFIGISARTIQRWEASQDLKDKRHGPKNPKNRLGQLEEQEVLKILNSKEFVDKTPSYIVPRLADRGTYMASESTMYRLLKRHKLNAHRGRSKVKKNYGKKEILKAQAPNQIWSWDITYLKSPVRGKYFYLYMYMDIFSRKIVGWNIYERECGILASDLVEQILKENQLSDKGIRIHSDNGAPMRGSAMRFTMQKLGIIPSFSRPCVSNDNCYSESLFKTLKHLPSYPVRPFVSIAAAKTWIENFVEWYNKSHLHSGISFVSPEDRHLGRDKDIIRNRLDVYRQAKIKTPSRWSNQLRNWKCDETVSLYGYRD